MLGEGVGAEAVRDASRLLRPQRELVPPVSGSLTPGAPRRLRGRQARFNPPGSLHRANFSLLLLPEQVGIAGSARSPPCIHPKSRAKTSRMVALPPTVSSHPTLAQVCQSFLPILHQCDLIRYLISHRLLSSPKTGLTFSPSSYQVLVSGRSPALIHEGEPLPSLVHFSEPLPSPGGGRPGCELGKR